MNNRVQILAAPDAAKEAFGLAGKCALDFRYLTADGKEADSVIEGRTDAQRFVGSFVHCSTGIVVWY